MAKKRKKLDRSDFIAFTALLMSMMAVFVSIYEARILKEQQLIMLSQEKTAVWPYLAGTLNFEYADKIRIQYEVENKGIGPARIRQMALTLNKDVIDGYQMLLEKITAYFPNSADVGVSFRLLDGQVLSVGETVVPLMIESRRFPGDLEKIRNLELNFDICYCSVYNDCWSIEKGAGGEQPACQ